MTQRQIRINGELNQCSCGKQPKHYQQLGKDTHFLECPPCGVRTAKYPTFQEAVSDWENRTVETFSTRRVA